MLKSYRTEAEEQRTILQAMTQLYGWGDASIRPNSHTEYVDCSREIEMEVTVVSMTRLTGQVLAPL
jgi:uncharacterized protein YueI